MSAEAHVSENKITKHYPYKLLWVTVLFLCTLFTYGVLTPTNTLFKDQSNPLLLNSGFTKASDAELRVVLWFEVETPPVNLRKGLPQEGWEWKESYRNTSNGSAYTLSGYKIIQSEEEKALYPWFQKLSKQVKELGGVTYLDEKVSEGIDIANYSVQQGINPIQWSLSESTISVAGQMKELYPMVRAGGDFVNIQMISQANDGKGKTAIAIPVLLEEF